MLCNNCGKENDNGALFCEHCGAKMEAAEPQNVQPAAEQQTAQKAPKKPVNKGVMSAIIAIAAVIVGLAIFFGFNSIGAISDEKAEILLEDVEEELSFCDYDSAAKIIKKIKLKDGSMFENKLSEIKEIVSVRPEVAEVDTSNYPNVKIKINTQSKPEYKKADFKVGSEDNDDVTGILEVETKNDGYVITYCADEMMEGTKVNALLKFAKYKDVEFALPFEFVSKYVEEADIELITSNIDNYPEISLYFRVKRKNGELIENLDKRNFRVVEYLNINDFLERDIIEAAKLDGQYALNVSLAIDKSDSISDTDMDKIKNATNTFLSKMQFASGDKAEIISFDDYVMQMCSFTNNKDYLTNGVNNMYPYGLTACYDAIVKGIYNASAQNGARCVIAFTDGMDNRSQNNENDVIRIAKEKSVPVYIIGVGSGVRKNILENIARSTGGTYHHINDISAISSIYDDIYREQKSMYMVKYISDASISQNAERRIFVEMSSAGLRGTCDRTYTPVVPVENVSHTSRYEVVKADISWEDANRAALAKGGHLATITSKDEENKIIEVVNTSGIERVWIGGYTTNGYDGSAVGHWVTGEPWGYQNWYPGEPSRFDQKSDGAAEFYLMLWRINNVWSWNDQRNDLITDFAQTYAGKMGYVIEYEN